ncbi:MAG: hypothetical protein AAF487_05450 [Bacteroidota bacterium]
MIKRGCIVLFLLLSHVSYSQTDEVSNEEYRKGSFYFYWGYNRGFYSKSNLHFNGPNYDFTLYNLTAHDRPSKFGSVYFNPRTLSIPQYNYRLGYFFTDRIAVSIGNDHMKYVIDQNQWTTISGVISPEASTEYAGAYLNEPIELKEELLTFDHTDGFNLLSLDVEYLMPIKEEPSKNFHLHWNLGIGGVWVVTKTRVKVLGDGLDNDFHIAGYTLSAKSGPRITYKNRIFLSSEIRAGYATLPSVLIKNAEPEIGDHNVGYLEYYIVFGYNFNIGKSNERNSRNRTKP